MLWILSNSVTSPQYLCMINPGSIKFNVDSTFQKRVENVIKNTKVSGIKSILKVRNYYLIVILNSNNH